ncbi:hypothetical protein M404DRAFT_831004 [Pisolithus tinctorius Marx 270]|uniref:Uncharacterized protein n=1 Tax=Pisolithus tinctorius Marx 270 TaxID=870435 RepID=A0A0C3PBH9_PISTI|nr:hypothetical protein M404DRAFT_831004 [Pisolithus tinctorius Marx 270]
MLGPEPTDACSNCLSSLAKLQPVYCFCVIKSCMHMYCSVLTKHAKMRTTRQKHSSPKSESRATEIKHIKYIPFGRSRRVVP